jgi:GH24 family phage-related lysozyme (muramidase)
MEIANNIVYVVLTSLVTILSYQLLKVECRQPLNVVNGTCNSFEAESLNEGYSPCAYNDHIGSPMIGIGFNLEKPGARKKIADVGADYELVRHGRVCLSDDQVRQLFDSVMAAAIRCASSWLLSVWSKMNVEKQSAVADMAFNMGCTRLKTFKNMKAALERQDYEKAEYEMRASRWCRQVRSRCDRATKCMQKT